MIAIKDLSKDKKTRYVGRLYERMSEFVYPSILGQKSKFVYNKLGRRHFAPKGGIENGE